MPDYLIFILIAYYIVGFMQFMREVFSSKLSESERLAVIKEDEDTPTSVVWAQAFKLMLYVLFIHIPMWIFR
ncbi:hypothetical protein pEaSNUABM14_00306 [Erwinia phage pEa_SNUABM_14]|uniref:Uncharacterized protein n=1 Tax=Erwinia phage pEa_SNUABM_7 TaxID=2866695 RepID=A0AAE8BLK9_9CAUD|nr:hypothetical protein MPK74_gp309 [Erwinia phage pEa_SNUABM_7]QYW03265.1 hypothetical protein pEaSNUABM13_00306 [Erwinia phage pEa_SNUABM_13]QYW03606.1 hypothetical protein pEaSNUABM34_00304 [Erwinia phage pEa_SNUABM_34]QYW03947.1 hypothetical protein pEaSNUABM45_00304 [Erwinia phage pEa_SNUABM_45]QYW04288.1 hypothetical protein pEaSNUABM46_00304 [Erwinia phage pEa_SNUABM_46]QYW04631.1 hypothetical protein pEaSNUABM14_00306 [Erwinia phage pEa_SNUABM_14]QYW05319.1 hypothetical protein pEaSNU